MKRLKLAGLLLPALLAFSCQNQPAVNLPTEASASLRIISLSGFLTEVLFDLGYGDRIVGRDVTSSYPPAAADIANLGHITQLNVEAILALSPDYVLVEESQLAQQNDVLQQIEGGGIKVIAVPTSPTLHNAVHAARALREHLDINETDIASLERQIASDSVRLVQQLPADTEQPKVLFIYARGTGRLMVGGRDTPAAAIIEKAGGQNAIQAFDGYRALTPEALLESAPDVILMFTSGLASLDGKEGLAQISGITQTPAYQNDRIVAMDGHYLTAFGPRAAKAAAELANKIHQRESI